MIKIKTFLKKIITRIQFEMFLRKIPEPPLFFDDNLFPFKRARAYSKKTDSDGSLFGGSKDKVDYVPWAYQIFKKQSRQDRNNCGFMGILLGLGPETYRKGYLNTLHRMLEYEERTGRNLISDAKEGSIVSETIEYPVPKTAEIVDEKTIPDDIKERQLSTQMKEEKEKKEPAKTRDIHLDGHTKTVPIKEPDKKPEEKQQEILLEETAETGDVAEPYEPPKDEYHDPRDTEYTQPAEELSPKTEKKPAENQMSILIKPKKQIKTQQDFEKECKVIAEEVIKSCLAKDPNWPIVKRGDKLYPQWHKLVMDAVHTEWLKRNPGGYKIIPKPGEYGTIEYTGIMTIKDYQNEAREILNEQIALIKSRDPNYNYPSKGQPGYNEEHERNIKVVREILIHRYPGMKIIPIPLQLGEIIPPEQEETA